MDAPTFALVLMLGDPSQQYPLARDLSFEDCREIITRMPQDLLLTMFQSSEAIEGFAAIMVHPELDWAITCQKEMVT